METEAEQKASRKAAFDAFRHEQTVKRWLSNNAKKPSKVVYLSDFLDHGAHATTHNSGETNPTGPANRRRQQRVLVPGTLHHTRHRWTHSGHGREHVLTARMPGISRVTRLWASKPRKQRDPHSTVPYNHRQKWTKLKRTIFDTRKRVFESQANSTTVDATTDVDDWQRAQETIHELEKMYAALDIAMHSRQRRLAAILMYRIRRKRLQLRRQLHNALLEEREGTGEAVPEKASEGQAHKNRIRTKRRIRQGPRSCLQSAADVPGQAVYSNFYPPTTALHVGQHPHRALIDRRTGRYPRTLAPETVQALARALADTAMSASTSGSAAATTEALPASDEVAVTPSSNRLFLAAYCRNVLDDTMEDLVFTLLQSLYVEQREVRQKQLLQFKARQRYVVGLQETIKFTRAGRVKLVILAGDMEVVAAGRPKEGGPARDENAAPKRKFQTLDEAVAILHALCGLGTQHTALGQPSSPSPDPQRAVPCVCSMTRQRLSYALFAKGSKISCIGVLHSDKHTQLLRAVIGYSRNALEEYEKVVPGRSDGG